MKDVVLEPQEILALYASEAQLERGHTVTFWMMMMGISMVIRPNTAVTFKVTLGDIKCQNQNIFLVIETTCPLPRVAPPPAPRDDTVVLDMKDFPLEDEEGEEEEEDLSEAGVDAEKSVVPEWLKAELQDAKSEDRRGRRGKKKRKAHERRERRGGGKEEVSRVWKKKQDKILDDDPLVDIWTRTFMMILSQGAAPARGGRVGAAGPDEEDGAGIRAEAILLNITIRIV